MTSSPRTITTPVDALVVIGMTFGLFILGSVSAAVNDFSSKPFTDAGLICIVITELVFAAAALSYLYLRGFSISTLHPRPHLKGALIGAGLYLAGWLLGQMLSLPFSDLVSASSQPVERMVSEAQVSAPAVIALGMVNGPYEEVFLLGVLLRGLRGHGLSIALGVTLLVRALCHLYQGPLGPLWVIGFSLPLAAWYMRSGDLWPPVFAHILGDIVPFLYS